MRLSNKKKLERAKRKLEKTKRELDDKVKVIPEGEIDDKVEVIPRRERLDDKVEVIPKKEIDEKIEEDEAKQQKKLEKAKRKLEKTKRKLDDKTTKYHGDKKKHKKHKKHGDKKKHKKHGDKKEIKRQRKIKEIKEMTSPESKPTQITIENDDVRTTITPVTKQDSLIAQTILDIKEQGMPTNEEMDLLGDELYSILDEAQKNTYDERTTSIIQSVKKTIEDLQQTMHEKNYDEKMQDVSRKMKEILDDLKLDDQMDEEEVEAMQTFLKEMLPLASSIVKDIMQDVEFRELIVCISNVLQSSYERAKENTEGFVSVPRDVEETDELIAKEKLKKIKKNIELTSVEYDEINAKTARAIIKMKRNPMYKRFFSNIFRLFDLVSNLWTRLSNNPEDKVIYEESTTIIRDIEILVERSCGKSLCDWEGYVNEVVEIRNDEKFITMRSHLEDALLDEQNKYMSEDRLKEMFVQINQELGDLNETYNNVFQNLARETKEIVIGISNDPYIQILKDDFSRMIKELFTDKDGKPSVTVVLDSISKIRDIFYPILKERLRYLYLPTVEVETKKYFFKLSHVILKFKDIIPDQIHIENTSDVHFNLDKNKRAGNLILRVGLYPFKMNLDKLHFFVKKKTGMKYKDSGILNIHMKKAGIHLNFVFNIENDNIIRIEMDKAEVDLGRLKIKVKKAKHDVLDKLITSLFMPLIKTKAQKALEEKLYTSLNDEVIYRINDAIKNIWSL
jgi:hypothetical protein